MLAPQWLILGIQPRSPSSHQLQSGSFLRSVSSVSSTLPVSFPRQSAVCFPSTLGPFFSFPVFPGCIVLPLNACILCLRPTILLDQPPSSILLLAVRSLERGNERARVPDTRLTPSFRPLSFFLLSLFASAKAGRLWDSLIFFLYFFFFSSAATPAVEKPCATEP